MSVDKDWNRKVSKPTEADFARGIAESATNHNRGTNAVKAASVVLLLGKLLRRL